MPTKKLSNPQKVFNRVARHLLRQRKRSTDGNSCLYRGPGGLKCAIGCLIKDKYYHPAINFYNMAVASVIVALRASGVEPMENMKVSSKLQRSWGVPLRVFELLKELQMTHDNLPPSRWAERLRAIARDFALDPSAAAGK